MEIIPDDKTCTKCKLTKALSEFGPKASGKFGLHSYCRACKNAAQKLHAKKYPERIKENAKKDYLKNADKYKARASKRYTENAESINAAKREAYPDNREEIIRNQGLYYEANREEISARRRKSYEENSEEQLRKQKVWRDTNKDAINKTNRERYANDPEFKAAAERAGMKRRALKLNAPSEDFSTVDVLAKWGIDCHLCMEPIDMDAPRRGGSGEGWERGLQLDHVIALSNGGSHTLDNVKPSHGICNLRKNRF
jgi:5-methylcytosine-specific restriction endonuclease McrA